MKDEAKSLLFEKDLYSRPRVISFAGATGGVGTTLLAANLGIHLAKKGRTVLLADLALTEAGCHLALGQSYPQLNLGSLISKKVTMMEEAIVPTSTNNLALLAGAPDLPEVANIAYLSKRKILGDLRELPFDYVLVDSGAGTQNSTLDFFLAGDYSVGVVQLSSVGLEPFYRFLRAALRRLLVETLNKKRYRELAPKLAAHSPLIGLWDMEETDEAELSALETAIKERQFCFVQTGLSSEKELRFGQRVESLIRRYFLCPVRCLGGVEWDAQAAEARRNLEPIAKAHPMSAFSLATEKLANIFLEEEKSLRTVEGHLTPRPMRELNHYQLLEVPYNATPKEIQSAYPKLLEPYLETSLLTLGLYGREEKEAVRERFEDAYKTLITTSFRQKYDDKLIDSGEITQAERVQEYGDLNQENNHPGSTSLSSKPVRKTNGRSSKKFNDILEQVETFNGPSLKKIREAQGISIAEIAAETNIRAWYLEAIEKDSFGDLPGLIYLKGFVRQVASYLHLDPDRVVKDYLVGYEASRGASEK